MMNDEITVEIDNKLPPTVIYRLDKHAAEEPEIKHFFPQLERLLKVPQNTVMAWLQVLSDNILQNASDFNLAEGTPAKLGSLDVKNARWSPLFQYRNALQKIDGGEISAALAHLDRTAPQSGLWEALRTQVARLHAKGRMIGVAALYQAICSKNAEALAEEPASKFDFEAWITSSVVFTKCQPCDRLLGIEYGISGKPFSAEFFLTKLHHAADCWESPKFRIYLLDSEAYESESEHELRLSTSWFGERKTSYDSHRGICDISILEDQSILEYVSTLSEETMRIDIPFLNSLWR
ncbi:hypothetical protein HDU90_000992 [Geranomyces variabilis]|nr:hypothetical protein HDU90_000992 [Geranomyces variabilis]